METKKCEYQIWETEGSEELLYVWLREWNGNLIKQESNELLESQKDSEQVQTKASTIPGQNSESKAKQAKDQNNRSRIAEKKS